MPERTPIKGTAAQGRVSAKIRHLHKAEPDMPHKQMVAMSLEMERKHRLGSKGAYRPVKKHAKPMKQIRDFGPG